MADSEEQTQDQRRTGQTNRIAEENILSMPDHNIRTCFCCPYECQLAPGEYGLCRVRLNEGQKIRAVTYGFPVRWHLLQASALPCGFRNGRMPLVTVSGFGCPLNCRDCHDKTLAVTGHFRKGGRYRYYRPEMLIDQVRRWEAKGIIFKGNEPGTWIEYAADVFKQ